MRFQSMSVLVVLSLVSQVAAAACYSENELHQAKITRLRQLKLNKELGVSTSYVYRDAESEKIRFEDLPYSAESLKIIGSNNGENARGVLGVAGAGLGIGIIAGGVSQLVILMAGIPSDTSRLQSAWFLGLAGAGGAIGLFSALPMVQGNKSERRAQVSSLTAQLLEDALITDLRVTPEREAFQNQIVSEGLQEFVEADRNVTTIFKKVIGEYLRQRLGDETPQTSTLRMNQFMDFLSQANAKNRFCKKLRNGLAFERFLKDTTPLPVVSE